MFAIVSLVVAGLLAAIVVLIIRGRRVSAPTAETPQIVYFENKRDSFLDWLYHRTSSPAVSNAESSRAPYGDGYGIYEEPRLRSELANIIHPMSTAS